MYKSTLLTLLMLSLQTISGQNNIVNKTIYNVNRHVDTALTYYGINDIEIHIYPTSHHIKTNKTDDFILNGTIQKGHNNLFVVYMNEKLLFDKFISVLYHEITHLKQLYYHELDLQLSKYYYRFKQDTLGKNTPAYRRKYEIEADNNSKIMIHDLGTHLQR